MVVVVEHRIVDMNKYKEFICFRYAKNELSAVDVAFGSKTKQGSFRTGGVTYNYLHTPDIAPHEGCMVYNTALKALFRVISLCRDDEMNAWTRSKLSPAFQPAHILISRSVLRDSTISGGSFINSRVVECDCLEGTAIKDSTLHRSIVKNSYVEDSVITEGASVKYSVLHGCTVENSYVERSTLSDRTLKNVLIKHEKKEGKAYGNG